MAKATTLDEAMKLLDPRPLDFSESSPSGEDAASNREFYEPKPGEQRAGGFALPPPIDRLHKRLLAGTRTTKLFLSGHVGSGKSTELSRLAADPEIRKRFNVVSFRFEGQEWAVLDAPQVLFRIAAELFAAHKDRLEKLDQWKKIRKSLGDHLFGPIGLEFKESSTSAEVNLGLLKLREELKLSAKARSQFHEYAETKQTALRALVDELVDAIENALTKEEGPNELLLIVDDLDKLRTEVQHEDIFATNLSTLLLPEMRILYTVPTAVRFADDVRAEIRQNAEDLFPVRVLKTAPGTWSPEEAYTDERLGFFNAVVERRVEHGLILPDAVRLAAMYSGGVLRDFFRLLREGLVLSIYNGLEVLDGVAMKYAVEEERRRESIGLYAPDYEALIHIHRTGALRTEADRRYLALARVLECWNGKVLFDAHPLLWSLLGEQEKKDHAAAGKP